MLHKTKIILSITLFSILILGSIGLSNYKNNNKLKNCSNNDIECTKLLLNKVNMDNNFVNKSLNFTKEELEVLYNEVKENKDLKEKELNIMILTSNYEKLIKNLNYEDTIIYLDKYLDLIENYNSERDRDIIKLKEENLNIKNFILNNKKYSYINNIENHSLADTNIREIFLYVKLLKGLNGEKIFEEMKKQQLNKEYFENKDLNFYSDEDNIAGIPGLI